MDEELRFHLEMEVEANIARGMSPTKARHIALRDLGGVTQTREAVRDLRAVWLESVWQDIRYAARMLRRSPGYTIAALLTLGVGIGATTAVFSVADAVALRPLPYYRADRLFGVHSRSTSDNRVSTGAASRDFLMWRDHQQVFERVTAVGGGAFNLVEGEPEELRGCRVTGELFATLGVRPLLGSVFGREHEVDGNQHVAVLGYGFWQRRFGGDPHIVGRRLQLDEGTYEVVAVMPQDFKYPPVGRAYDLWVPLTFDAADRSLEGASPVLGAVVRLKDGVTPEQATAHLDMLSARLEPIPGFQWRPFLLPLQEEEVGTTRHWMALLLGSAAFVLLIACANVAHLTLSRGSGRARELAVRAALGGGRLRLMRQLATESLLISGIATMVGLVLAWWGVCLLGASAPTSMRRIAEIAIDGRVLAFAVVAGLATGLVCGVFPALRGAKADVVEGLKDSAAYATASRRGRRIREALAFTEVALSFVLLAGASLFIFSFIKLMSVNPGFDVANVVTLQISVPRGVNKAGRGLAEQEALVERLRQVPGISGAGLITGGWMFGGGRRMYPAHKPGEPRPKGTANMSDEVWVSPGFFRVLGVPLLRGRDLTDRDTMSAPPVILLNQTAARRYWLGADPIGHRLVIEDRTYEVVGLVGDIAHLGSDPGPRPELYMAAAQKKGAAYGSFVVRTTVAPADVMPGIRQVVRSVWPHQPISRLATLEDDIARTSAARRFNMLLMTVFGVLALVIAISGLNGVMACSVEQRRREMAIRLALGAQREQLLARVLGRSTVIVVLGVAAGVAGAWALGRFVESYLFEVRAHDARILSAVGFLLALAAIAACWSPARRASRVDPIVTLKAE